MRVLVTGASGFSGRHMIRHLASLSDERPEVFGASHSTPLPPDSEAIPVMVDLSDTDRVARMVRRVDPELVIHLAGLNHGSLRALLEVNVTATDNLLNAVLHEAPKARVLVIGSSAEYGYAGLEPIAETAPLRPVSPYGVSKAAEDLLALRYHAVHSLPVAVAVPFNLVGPGLPVSFVCSRIVEQAIQVAEGERGAIDLLRTDSRRDFIDVRDAVAAYWRVLTAPNFIGQCAGRKYNIGSGIGHSIETVVDLACRVIGKACPVKLPEDSAPELVPTQVADIRQVRDLTGWSPGYTLETSIRDMVDRSLRERDVK